MSKTDRVIDIGYLFASTCLSLVCLNHTNLPDDNRHRICVLWIPSRTWLLPLTSVYLRRHWWHNVKLLESVDILTYVTCILKVSMMSGDVSNWAHRLPLKLKSEFESRGRALQVYFVNVASHFCYEISTGLFEHYPSTLPMTMTAFVILELA